MGLWIDHREAVLVTSRAEGEETTRIYSDIEVDAPYSGSSRSAGSQDAENMQDKKYTNNLGRFYGAIIGYIRDADSIRIFGPGEAKGALEKHLKSENLEKRIVSTATTDKLTDPQIAAKVRQQFAR